MSDVSRDEFEMLRKQVRTLERKVEEQQKQIATLKRRTTTDAAPNKDSSSDDSSVEVPRSSSELAVLDSLRENSAGESEVAVKTIKNEAAQSGLLRSQAKAVVRKWINAGYLVGDVDGSVKVAEWPSETVPPE